MSQVKTPTLDLANLSCLDQAKHLYNAYLRMLSGGQRTVVRHNDFWSEYRSNTAGDMDRLRELYETIRSGCPAAQKALPSLDPAGAKRRGKPATLCIG